jgi:neutral trehalase
MNKLLKEKMKQIRKQVESFNFNIDKFGQICDQEVSKLTRGVEKAT